MQRQQSFPCFRTPDDWERTTRSSPRVWLETTGPNLSTELPKAWSTLPAGGFLGGPSYGTGPLPKGGFAFDTRTPIDTFRASISDASELILGNSPHPCWMLFKTTPQPQNILLLSGCDPIQMNYFGRLTQRNHLLYARSHHYQTRWHLLDPREWGGKYRDLVWAKTKLVADALAEGTWDQVWWLDADVAFINLEKRLHNFFHPSWQALLTDYIYQEEFLLATGVFGARPAAEPLMRQVWEHGDRRLDRNEESALTSAVITQPNRWSHVQAFAGPLLNTVYSSKMSFRDPASTFTCHLVSRSNQQRRKVFWDINQALGIQPSQKNSTEFVRPHDHSPTAEWT
ncbi:MAG: hypothetical protein AAGC74_10430 [Verrucomicrobiota bacterium]